MRPGEHTRGRILHVFKDLVKDPRQVYLGSTKDIKSRTDFFENCGLVYDELTVNQDHDPDRATLDALADRALDHYATVIFEHSLFPRSIQYLKKNNARLNVLFRGHNAEFYHRLHYALGAVKYTSLGEALKWLKESLTKYREDSLCARHADYVLSISAWETAHYWPRFTASHTIINAPFYLTDFYLDEIRRKKRPKTNRCVCLMSTFIGPFLYDALHHYQKIVGAIRDRLPDWDFATTGAIPKKWRKRQKQMNYVGLVESPLDILSESRAMCILSDLGYGFKTKIIEAIMCGCYVIVPEKLYGRLPQEVRPFCKVVNLKDPTTFIAALNETHQPFPDFDPNAMLKKTAIANYASVIDAEYPN